jgi:hyperosmotically inducible periplasmic protein
LKTLLHPTVIFWLALSMACNSQTGRVEPGSSTATDSDNAARNSRERDIPTAEDQAQNRQDLEITANIRKAVISDNSLSLNAHNVKIISSSGVVTLRGPVKSEEEKALIEARAKDVKGVTQVVNLLEVESQP